MKKYIFCFLLLITYTSCMAGDDFSIHGNFVGTLSPKTVRITFYRQYFEQCPSFDTLIELNDRSFSFTAKKLSGPAYVSILYGGAKPLPPWRLFLVYPGDHVVLENRENKNYFTGIGAERFALSDTLSGLFYNKVASLHHDPDMYNALLRKESALDSLYRLRVALIDQHMMDPQTASILKLDALAERWTYSFWMFIANWAATKDSSIRNKMQKFYSDHYATVKVNAGNIDKKVAAWFTRYIYEKAKLDVLMLPGNKLTFGKLNDHIITTYKGVDRSIALIESFSLSQRFRSVDSLSFLLRRASNLISEPWLKKILASFNNSMRKGMPAFDFSLANYLGGTTRLKDLRGRVLLLDFWFTGCRGCADLAVYKKKLMDSLAHNKDIAFVSISIDRDKERWKKSVAAQTYGTLEEINLYTNGLGAQHPLIMHYHYSGYPQVLVIDRHGNIYDAAPTRPHSAETLLELRRILEKAADEK